MKKRFLTLILVLLIVLSTVFIVGCDNSNSVKSDIVSDESDTNKTDNNQKSDEKYKVELFRELDGDVTYEYIDVKWDKINADKIQVNNELEYGIFPLQTENELTITEGKLDSGYTAIMPDFVNGVASSDEYYLWMHTINPATNEIYDCFGMDEYLYFINYDTNYKLNRVVAHLLPDILDDIKNTTESKYFHFSIESREKFSFKDCTKVLVRNPISEIYLQETDDYYIGFYLYDGVNISSFPGLCGHIFPKYDNYDITFHLEHNQLKEENIESIAHQVAKYSCKKEEITAENNAEEYLENDESNWSPEKVAYEEARRKGESTYELEKALRGTYKKYPAVSEWSDVTVEDCAIQIDDVLYVPGCTVSELLSQVENSVVEYGFYNAPPKSGEMIESHKKDTFIVSRDYMQWFVVEYYNFSNTSLNIDDCVVISIEPWEHTYPFIRLFDGRSYEDCCSLTFDDVMNLSNTLFIGEHWHHGSIPGQYYDENIEKHEAYDETFVMGNTYSSTKFVHTGYDVKLWTRYSFLIDPADGEVKDIKIYYDDFIYE